MRALMALLAASFLLLLTAGGVAAHVRESTGYSQISREGGTVSYDLSLEFGTLAKAVGLGDEALDTTSDDRRATILAERVDPVSGYLDERLTVYADGVACPMTLTGTSVVTREDLPYADLALRFDCAAQDASSWTIDYEVFRPQDAVVDDHTNIVDHTLLGAADRELLVGPSSFTAGERSWLGTAWQFGQLGFHHILAGLDHVLFVVALALGARGWRSLLANVTVFTLAHSVSLGLAAVGWVALPSSVIEPLIALSIAFVALDGLIGQSRHRLWAVFAFGLLHGLGFAGALQVDDGAVGALVFSLLSFNVGVEVGQLLVLAITVPLLAAAVRWAPQVGTWLPRVAALGIAAMGLLWFVERLLPVA